jgi:SAM-dependent methyltransferase
MRTPLNLPGDRYVGAVANEKEANRWNHDQWVTAWPSRERLTEALSPHLLEAAGARPGQRVCEIGCGGGLLSIALAGGVAPNGQLVGVDISAPLVELARDRASEAGVSNIEFLVLDAQTDRFGEDPFDLAVSQLGVMFFDEPTVAFGAIRAALRPGGRFVFACWQGVEQNPWHAGTALRAFVPPPKVPPPGKSPVGPFALGDDEYVRDVLGAAGFTDVESTALEITVRAPASAVADPSLLPFMGVPPQRLEEAEGVLEAHLQTFVVGPDEYDYPLAFRIYEAVNG